MNDKFKKTIVFFLVMFITLYAISYIYALNIYIIVLITSITTGFMYKKFS